MVVRVPAMVVGVVVVQVVWLVEGVRRVLVQERGRGREPVAVREVLGGGC